MQILAGVGAAGAPTEVEYLVIAGGAGGGRSGGGGGAGGYRTSASFAIGASFTVTIGAGGSSGGSGGSAGSAGKKTTKK